MHGASAVASPLKIQDKGRDQHHARPNIVVT
jgi:hypothetical protein